MITQAIQCTKPPLRTFLASTTEMLLLWEAEMEVAMVKGRSCQISLPGDQQDFVFSERLGLRGSFVQDVGGRASLCRPAGLACQVWRKRL